LTYAALLCLLAMQSDFFVVMGSWLDLIVTLFEIQFINASLFRVIRIARVSAKAVVLTPFTSKCDLFTKTGSGEK